MTAKIKTIRSSWWEGYGYRLDCQPYLAGALETKIILERLPNRKEPLHTLTSGPEGGIFHAGREKRQWVNSPEYGLPFLGSTDILAADLSNLPLISKRQVEANPLLLIHKGYTLITRSGTIGRLAYARPEMDGMACSEHALRVRPDTNKIPPGYLYAFLSSKFGIPLIVSGTYGSIIQEIEPRHIAGIPVPRLVSKIELGIHDLVEKAAQLRTMASHFRKEAVSRFQSVCEIPDIIATSGHDQPIYSEVSGSVIGTRMDSFYYAPINLDARQVFDRAESQHGSKSLGDAAEVFIPEIFKRQYSDDPEYGYPYLTGADVFTVTPSSNQYLLRNVAEENRLLLTTGMILIHEAGSLNGIIGHSVMVGETLNGFACTNNMVRIVPKDDVDGGYIYAALSSEYGVRLIKREAAGSAIPHIERNRISNIHIPWPMRPNRKEVAEVAIRARKLLDEANELEREAQQIINSQIEK